MRLTLHGAAAVLIGVYMLALPFIQASPLPVRVEDRIHSNLNSQLTSSVSNVLRNIFSFLTPDVRLVETFPALELAKRRVIADEEGFGSAPSTGWGDAAKSGLGDAPKQGMGKKPKTGMGKKPKTGTGKKPKQKTGKKPQQGMGNSPRGFCATCLSSTDTTPSIDRVVEPNTGALEDGLTDEEANRVMNDNGRSWVKREASDARALVEEEANRVMGDNGRSWVKREASDRGGPTEEHTNRAMNANSQRWGRGLTEAEADRAMDDNGRSWVKRNLEMARDGSQISDKHWDKRDIRSDRSTGPSAEDGANQISAVDKRFRVYEGPTSRPSRPSDGETSNRDGHTVRTPEGTDDDRTMEADGARWSKRVDGRGVCNGCIRDIDIEAESESGKSGSPLKDFDWQKRKTEDGRGGSTEAEHDWARRSGIPSHDVEPDMARANADFDWSKRQDSGHDSANSASIRVPHPNGFIMVDKRNNPEARSQDPLERVTRHELAKGARKRDKREVSDILWEFIPEGQSRIGRI